MRYVLLVLLLIGSNSIWGQINLGEFTMTTQLKTIATSVKNNGKLIFIKPEANLTSDLLFKEKVALNLSEFSTFKITSTIPLNNAYVMERHNQYLDNIRVENGVAIVYLNNGIVDRVQGDWVKDMPVFNTFVLTPETVVASVLAQYPATEYAWQNDFDESSLKRRENNESATYYPKPEQVYYQKDGKLYAAFSLELHASTPSFDYKLIINGENGEVLNQENLMHDCFGHNHEKGFAKKITKRKNDNHSKKITSKVNTETVAAGENCIERTNVAGLPSNYKIHTYSVESLGKYRLSNDCNGTLNLYDWNAKNQLFYYNDVKNAITAKITLYNLETIYAYYKKTFNRLGWNNKNGNIDVFLNGEFTGKDSKGKDYQYYSNATFGNGIMWVGNDDGNTDASNTRSGDDYNTIDIIGHEFTHGVVATTSKLVYQGESGALNESFADIFGNLIEIDNEGFRYDAIDDNGNNVTLDSWNMGEDRMIFGKLGQGIIRNMANPKLQGQPDTYNGERWASTTAEFDFGGVHVNSGVQNYFFYLLCVGGSGVNDNNDEYNITPIGINKAQQLAYKVLQSLSPNSNYYDSRIAWISQAEIMFGTCSPEFLSVKEAWNAVGVSDIYGDRQYCKVIEEGTLSSERQLIISGYSVAINNNCSVEINTTPGKELMLKAGRDVIINTDTVIAEGANVILQIDPCDW